MENYANIPDPDILVLLKKGNPHALKELFDRYYDDLFDQAEVSLGHLSAFADDIVQQVFIDFWQQRKFEAVEGSVKSYLAGMMYHKISTLVRDEYRKKSNVQNYLDHQSAFAQEHPYEKAEMMALLQKEISELPEQCRRVFIAAYIEEHTYQEVAESFGISKNTVKTYMKNAMSKLKTALKNKKS